MKMKKMMILVLAGVIGTTVNASLFSAPVKVAVKGGEKVAAKLGLRAASKTAAHGGAKLAAVTAERAAAKRTAGGVAEGAAKHVTAKQLLAAGGGTALVVAAHEAADGVQQMGEGVKEAVVANPELAGDVAKSVAAPMRYAVPIGCAALLVFLVWLLWPWVSLARNWSRLAAARRAAAMRSSAPLAGGTADVIDVEPLPAASARSGFTHVELILVLAGFVALTIIGVWRMMPGKAKDPSGAGKPAITATADSSKAIARRKAAVARMHVAYVEALERHHRAFLSEVEQVADSQFGRVRAGISGVVAKFGTFSRCKDLFKTIVVDRIKGGDRTGASIKSDLEADFYRGLYEARDRVHESLESFLRNAESEREAFKVELEAELDSVALPGDDAYKALLEECGERIEQKKGALKWGQIDAGIACVIEAVCIRQTVAAAARVLGNAAARQAGTMVAGGTAAVADGPLPVGDIIGGLAIVGCTAWSAWDIYKAAKVLPEELRSTLETATRDCERQTLDEVKNAGETIYRAFSSEKPLAS